jgi:hypothetical protein
VAAGDFTGSGKQDLVTTGFAGGATLLLNNGDGTFRSGSALPGGARGPVAVGDLTGNRRQDIVVGNFPNLNVLLGNGDGTFQAPLTVPVAPFASIDSLTLTDVTGDGRLDLVVLYTEILHNHQFAQVFLGNGDGTFEPAAAVPLNSGSAGLAVGDFFGDGKQDLVIGSNVNGTVSVLRGNGDGTFQAPVILHAGNDARAVAVGDFAGNGKQGIAVIDARSGTVNVLLGNGDGSFQAPVAYPVGHGVALAVGNFFGDGNLSLAVDNPDRNTVSVLRGNGDGTFQSAVDYLVGAQGAFHTADLVVGDFLGHGPIDLAATNFMSGDVSVLLNRTDGGGGAPRPASPAGSARALSPAAVEALFAATRPEPQSRVVSRQPVAAAVDAVFSGTRAEAAGLLPGPQAVADTLPHRHQAGQAEAADAGVTDPLAAGLAQVL